MSSPIQRSIIYCPVCEGSGFLRAQQCSECFGRGVLWYVIDKTPSFAMEQISAEYEIRDFVKSTTLGDHTLEIHARTLLSRANSEQRAQAECTVYSNSGKPFAGHLCVALMAAGMSQKRDLPTAAKVVTPVLVVKTDEWVAISIDAFSVDPNMNCQAVFVPEP